MTYLDCTLSDPQANLACDEALLDLCESGWDHEVLRVWEPEEHFVVLGVSGPGEPEVNIPACRQDRIGIYRRCSGGGAVLQGPGCLNYSLVLKVSSLGPPTGIPESTRYILSRHREALESVLGERIDLMGTSDLTLRGKKFSGNAQRRRRRYILFHGTFLLNLDLSLVSRLLPVPQKQPAYRRGRAHEEFLINLRIPPETVKEALRAIWHAEEVERPPHLPFVIARSQATKQSDLMCHPESA